MDAFPYVRLGSVCERVTVGHVGETSSHYRDSGVPFLRTQNVGEGRLLLNEIKFVTSDFHKRLSKSQIRSGDVLISRVISDGVNCAVIPEGFEEANCANVILVRPNAQLDPKYLVYFISSPTAQRQLLRTRVGSAQSVVNTKVVEGWAIPLPPIAEQRRIAAILDRADAVRRKRQQAIALTEELLRSAFLEMFGDPVTNPKGWQVVKIGGITTIKTCKTPSRDEPDNYGGSIRWVKTTEVKDVVIEDTEEYLTEKGASQMTIFPINSLLIAMYGQGTTRGRTALLKKPCATNQACAVILPNEKFRPNYLWTLLKLSYERLRELGREGNQPNLNLDMIKQFEIPLPPLEKQQGFDLAKIQVLNQKEELESSYQLLGGYCSSSYRWHDRRLLLSLRSFRSEP